MVSTRFLVLMVISADFQVQAKKIDFESIFQTPKRNHDDLEILERSNFEVDDEEAPQQSNNYIRDEPKAIANAQVLLTFPHDDSIHKTEHKKLPVIESRGFIGPDLLPPHNPKRLYPPYHLTYPPLPDEPPYYYPKDIYYSRYPYQYEPPPIETGPHFPHGNYIHKEYDAPMSPPIIHEPSTTVSTTCSSPRTSTTTSTTPLPPTPPAKCCQIYEELLVIIEKMTQYLLNPSPPCNIKFDDDEKLKIAEALNIIIRYLNIKCQELDVDLWTDKKVNLDVDVSLILEDILSMLPVTLLQARHGKLELIDELDCLLDMVRYIRDTYSHVCGLCGIYKNMRDIFKPCIFLRDCKFNNYLSKENIRGYLLMDSLNLALYLVQKNNVSGDLPQKKHAIVDLWVNYLYKTQFMNCNEVFATKTPLIQDVKCTEELLAKLQKLFLYQYVLRLKEKDPEIQGIDSIISFCKKKPIVFPVTPQTITETCREPDNVLQKDNLNLDQLLLVVENYLKQKYNFDSVPHPATAGPISPSTQNYPTCLDPFGLRRDPIVPPADPGPVKPFYSQVNDPGPINFGQVDPIVYPNPGPIDPIYIEHPKPINLEQTYPFKRVDPGPLEPICPEPEKPLYINHVRTDPIKEINRGQERPVFPNYGQIGPFKGVNKDLEKPERPISTNYGQIEPFIEVNKGPEEPEGPLFMNYGQEPNKGPEEPERPIFMNYGQVEPCNVISRDPKQPEKPIFINYGQTEPLKDMNNDPEEPEKPIYINWGNEEPDDLETMEPPCVQPDEPIRSNLEETKPIYHQPPEEECNPPAPPYTPHIIAPRPDPDDPIETPPPCPKEKPFNLDPDEIIYPDLEEPEPQPEIPIPCEPTDAPNSDEPNVNLGPQAPIVVPPGEIYLLGPDDLESTDSVNLGDMEPIQGNAVELEPTDPDCMEPDDIPTLPTDSGPIHPIYVHQHDEDTDEGPDNIRTVTPDCSKKPTESTPTEPIDEERATCSDQPKGSIMPEPIPITDPPQILVDKDDCPDVPEDIDVIPVKQPGEVVQPTYFNPNQMVLVPRPLVGGQQIPYLPGCPMVMFYPSQPGSEYNILTSSQPVPCLSCPGGCGKGDRKFPADVDALNPVKGKEPAKKGDTPDTTPKETSCKFCGGKKVCPNGRRCPFCAPYVKELDFY
ncbi:hypothetical protein Trydic_g9219 [Trypoxylus dichotomus]